MQYCSVIYLDKIQKTIFVSIVFITVAAWLFSIERPDMMEAMMALNPMAVTIFVSSWTIGMAAMMFPAIVPLVLLYNRMLSNSQNGNNDAYGAKSMFGGPSQCHYLFARYRLNNSEFPNTSVSLTTQPSAPKAGVSISELVMP
jgi:hypothetical protein